MTIPVAFIMFSLQHAVKLIPHSQYDDGTFFNIFNVLNLSTLAFAFPLYEIMKRKMTKQVYNKENISIAQLFLLPISASITATLFGFIPMTIGGVQILRGGKFTHQVAQKMSSKKR